MSVEKKILGGLLLAAVGDGLGAATETRNTKQIIEKFGGYVRDFVKIPDDVFARGFEKGSVTDDFSLAYYTALAIIESDGKVSDETAKNALLKWSETKYYSLAGPTTMAAVNSLKGIETTNNIFVPAVDNSKGTNGSAMKISPVGLASKGNVQKAMDDTIVICKPTHFNSASLSAACAVSAAVSATLKDGVTLDEVISAALEGAKYGQQFGKQLSTPSVYKRIQLALDLGKKYKGNNEKLMEEITDVVGSGLAAYEAVPAAFGLLAGIDDPFECVVAAVNMGNDTDTVATIVGAIAGSYYQYYDERFLNIIDEVNGFDLRKVASQLEKLNG